MGGPPTFDHVMVGTRDGSHDVGLARGGTVGKESMADLRFREMQYSVAVTARGRSRGRGRSCNRSCGMITWNVGSQAEVGGCVQWQRQRT